MVQSVRASALGLWFESWQRPEIFYPHRLAWSLPTRSLILFITSVHGLINSS